MTGQIINRAISPYNDHQPDSTHFSTCKVFMAYILASLLRDWPSFVEHVL